MGAVQAVDHDPLQGKCQRFMSTPPHGYIKGTLSTALLVECAVCVDCVELLGWPLMCVQPTLYRATGVALCSLSSPSIPFLSLT